MLGVKPHVLRYWEQEFPALCPKKTRGAHRHYSREDVALARAIHALVVESGYSIAGARNKLVASNAMSGDSDAPNRGVGDGLEQDLLAIRSELLALLAFLDEDAEPTVDEPAVDEVRVPVTRTRSR